MPRSSRWVWRSGTGLNRGCDNDCDRCRYRCRLWVATSTSLTGDIELKMLVDGGRSANRKAALIEVMRYVE